jgi:uncharacterized protein Yka (UPF0111/DUF47 family)
VTARLPWVLSHRPDILGLLSRQAIVTEDGLKALARWSASGSGEDAQAVRDAEHAGDDIRRELLELLSVALTTPIDQEDAYELSERVDEVLDRAKDVVRLAGALDWSPDDAAAAMANRAAQAAAHVCKAVSSLGHHHDHGRLGEEAEHTIKSARQVEHELLAGLSALARDSDGFQRTATLEVYRAYSAIGQALERVAARIRYAALKVT